MRIRPTETMRRALWRSRSGAVFTLVTGPLLVLYLLTATWRLPYHIDPLSNVLPAWSLGTSGTVFLDDHVALATPDQHRNLAWLEPVGDSAVSQYPPGTALFAAPFYAAWPRTAEEVTLQGTNRPQVEAQRVLLPPLGPAALAASVAVAVTMGLVAVTVTRLGASRRAAVVAGYVGGVGTSAWSVAADMLWQHGPAMLWIAVGLVVVASSALGGGGAWALAILTRPVTAVVPAVTGLWMSVRRRAARPALAVGLAAALGLLALMAYNAWLFGSPSVSGGYGPGFRDQAVDADVVSYARNVALGMFSATRGLFVWSPFLLALLPGLRAAWRAAPDWVQGAGLAAVAYLLVHWKLNRYSGGDGFFAYRYPLEALVAAAPLLYLAFSEWVRHTAPRMRAFQALVAVSVAAHALGAVGLAF